LVAASSLAGAVVYARGVAVIYALLTVLGLIPATNTAFGLVPIYGHDVWLHAAVAAYFGFVWKEGKAAAAAA
jgi:hypothetical protein